MIRNERHASARRPSHFFSVFAPRSFTTSKLPVSSNDRTTKTAIAGFAKSGECFTRVFFVRRAQSPLGDRQKLCYPRLKPGEQAKKEYAVAALARFDVALFLPTTRLVRVEACLDNQNPAFSARSSRRRSLPSPCAVSNRTPLDRPGAPGGRGEGACSQAFSGLPNTTPRGKRPVEVFGRRMGSRTRAETRGAGVFLRSCAEAGGC